MAVDHRSFGKSEGNVGYAEYGAHSVDLSHFSEGFQGDFCTVLLGADGHGQHIDNNIFLPDSVFCGLFDDFSSDLHSSVCIGRYSLFV